MAKVNPKIIGLDKVMANLNREIVKIKGRSMAGLIEASMLIHRDMERTSPTVPADTGNLRASWFTVTATGVEDGAVPNFDNKNKNLGELVDDHSKAIADAKMAVNKMDQILLIMGFSANYAVFVHEMGEAEGAKSVNWNVPGSGAKFFEASLNRNKQKILQIIRDNAYIK